MFKVASKTRLIIFVSVIAVVILAGALVWGLAGLNLSLSYNGGSQLTIICQEKEEAEKAQKAVSKVLKDNNVSVYEVSNMSSGAEYRVVFTTKDKNVPSGVSLAARNAVSDINLVSVNGFDVFQSSFKTKTWVIAVTMIALGIVFSLAMWLIAKRWADVLAFGIGYVAICLSAFSILILTRIEIGETALAGYFIGVIINSIISMMLFIHIKNAQDRAINQDKNLEEVSAETRKRFVVRDMLLYAVVMVGAILSVAVGSTEVVYFGVALALSLMCAVFVSYYLTVDCKCQIENAFKVRYQTKMNVAETVVQSQTKKQKAKTPRPAAASVAPVKVQNKKRKRRNKSNSNKVVV